MVNWFKRDSPTVITTTFDGRLPWLKDLVASLHAFAYADARPGRFFQRGVSSRGYGCRDVLSGAELWVGARVSHIREIPDVSRAAGRAGPQSLPPGERFLPSAAHYAARPACRPP